jgi:predicted Zn finger-like uncharacterized protein
MRLTCPNCGAQYEVPDDVIPEEGRDVQCSNCGTTWFQPHGDNAEPQPIAIDPEEVNSALEDMGETPKRARQPADDEGGFDEDDDLPEQMPAAAEMQRRPLNDDVANILQQEAERETRLRAEEAGTLETQPDLGLDDTADDAERRALEARARMDRLKGPQAEFDPDDDDDIESAMAAAAAAAKSSRVDSFPDIDEINSSLRATPAPATRDDGYGTDDVTPDQRKSGFLRGFAIPIIVITLLMLLYANAPRLAEAVPALTPVLNTYVALVDQLRGWLDGAISSFMP